MSEQKLTARRSVTLLFVICWVAYFTCYIGRLNFSSAITTMIGDGVFSRTQAGFISMVYFFVYGAGQLLNGFLGDRVHPGRMILTGLMISMCCNLAMGFSSAFGVMVVVWGVNGYAQAMVWPPIIRIFSRLLTEETKLRCCINIVSTQALGTLASYLLSAAVLAVSGWQMVFFSAAVCLLATGLLWMTGFKKLEHDMSFAVDWKAASKEKANAKGRKKNEQDDFFGGILLHGGLWVIVFPVVVHGILKDGVTTWVPTYIYETFHTSASVSILATTLLPVVNVSGAYIARYLYRKCHGSETKAALSFFGASVAALAILWGFGSVFLPLTVVMLAIITASMMGVNTLFVNILPLRFEKQGRVASVSGFLNASAYVGTAVSSFTIGVTVEKLGWQSTIAGWVLLTAAGLIACLAIAYRRRTGATQTSCSSTDSSS